MESAKKSLETNYHYQVLAGFISPSSDRFIQKKLGKLFPLAERCKLICTATEDSSWLTADASGLGTNQLLKLYEVSVREFCPDVEIIKVAGADVANEVLRRVPKPYRMAVVRRPNCDEELEKFLKTTKEIDRILPVKEWRGPDISSTTVRKLFHAKDFNQLYEMMPKKVVHQMVDENMINYI